MFVYLSRKFTQTSRMNLTSPQAAMPESTTDRFTSFRGNFQPVFQRLIESSCLMFSYLVRLLNGIFTKKINFYCHEQFVAEALPFGIQ